MLSAAAAWAEQPPAAEDRVVLTVGNEKVTQLRFERIVAALPAQSHEQIKTPEGRRALGESIARIMLLAADARSKKLDRDGDVQVRLEIQADEILATLAYQAIGVPDEPSLRAYYEAHKAEWEEVHLRAILVRTQGSPVPPRAAGSDRTEGEALQKAERLRAQVASGAAFADVAAAGSDDVASAAKGGEMGTFSRSTIIPDLEAAAFSLPTGQVSEPLRSALGYHLLLVESRTTKAFGEVRSDIAATLSSSTSEKALDALTAKAGVTLDDAYFGKRP